MDPRSPRPPSPPPVAPVSPPVVVGPVAPVSAVTLVAPVAPPSLLPPQEPASNPMIDEDHSVRVPRYRMSPTPDRVDDLPGGRVGVRERQEEQRDEELVREELHPAAGGVEVRPHFVLVLERDFELLRNATPTDSAALRRIVERRRCPSRTRLRARPIADDASFGTTDPPERWPDRADHAQASTRSTVAIPSNHTKARADRRAARGSRRSSGTQRRRAWPDRSVPRVRATAA